MFRERRPTGRFSSSLFSSLVKSFLASGTEENGRHIAVRGDLTAQIYTGEFFQPHLCLDLTRVARSRGKPRNDEGEALDRYLGI